MSEWERVTIAGKPADVFEPEHAPRFALLFLHDVEGESLPDTALLRQLRLACVAPQAPQSWWVDRVCPAFDPTLTAERFLLDHVVPWMESRWKLGPRAVGVAGVGVGGQGAVRLAFKYPERFPVVASAAGAFDFHEWHGRGTPLDAMYETRERARQDTAILHLDPAHWPLHLWFACSPDSEWHRGNDRLHEKLTAYGVPHTADLDTKATRDALVEAMLRFVANGLEREARRLV